ncbi:MAG: fibronectin type III domain-containing protein [Bacteroidales bacterium]|nr:fibronectin type III domain-containing protein [Bacteroidales bacterium]
MNRICFVSLIALAAFAAVTACEKGKEPQKLATPEPVLVKAGVDNATFLWESVSHADSYELVLDDGAPVPVKGVSFTFHDLTSGNEYSLKIKAVAPKDSEDWIDSDFSEPLVFKTAGKTVLAKPVLSVADRSSGEFTVTWDEVRNAGKYICKVNDGAEVETGATSFTATGLTHSTEYTLKVKSAPAEDQLNLFVESDWAEIKVTTTGITKLDAPMLSYGDVTPNGFTVTWPAVNYAGKYNYKLDGGALQSTTEPSAVITGLTANTTHTVEVQAAPSDAQTTNYEASEWASVEVTTLDLIALGAPTLRATSVLGVEFTIAWDAVPHAARYMCSINDGAYAPVTGTSKKFEGLTPETAYTVKVYAEPADAERITYKDGPASSISVTTKRGPSDDDKDGDLSDFEEKPIF